ncbi:hypothetical protein [uncultured Metabacillus sp.]|uniref:hypothetical protein n=1 Tax=uncultured Metabacillus sp. TaxID=2860135 RepID=UPI0026182E2B|nr:hypothetical protein [uncultured Metabacillus sp.]
MASNKKDHDAEKKKQVEEKEKHQKIKEDLEDCEVKVKKRKECEIVFDKPIRINIEDVVDELFDQLLGLIDTSILIVTESDQLNLFGQTFRPIFCGTIINVTQSAITLFPVNIKMINAPFFQFPTPLTIPLEKIAHFTPNFDCNQRIPLT